MPSRGEARRLEPPNGPRIALAFAVLAITGGLSAASASASDEKPSEGGTFTFQVENDRVVNTDRHYTNGLRLGWVSRRRDDGPEWTRDLLDWLYPLADVSGGRIGFAGGHNIYTPEDTNARALIDNDRPYAGWLYAEASLHAEALVDRSTPDGPKRALFDHLDSVALNLGIVGPHAYGEFVQNEWHDLIGVARSNGWSNQLRDEPALGLFFERRWRSPSLNAGEFLELDAIPHIGGALGNLMTAANAGLTLRLGQGLRRDWGPPHIRPTMSGLDAISGDDGFAWYLFGSAEARAVAWDIFLDGNSFRDSHSVGREPFVGDFQLGAAILMGDARIAFTHVFRTRQFKGQRESDRFGSLSFSYRF